MLLAHATTVLVDGVGVLIRGPSGSGKSDLALRLVDRGAQLVADDQTVLAVENGLLMAYPPRSIAGRLEVRGLGIVTVPWAPSAPVGLAVDLVPPGAVERLPEPATADIYGVSLPLLRLTPFEASAPAKLRLAVAAQKAAIIHPATAHSS